MSDDVAGDVSVPASPRYQAAVAAIDAANAVDPTMLATADGARPRALVHGSLVAAWVERLDPAADEVQLLAARAHHLRRWEVARSTYPDGRAGYLRWRTDQKARHAALLGELMVDAGYPSGDVERAQGIVRKERLARDPAVQTHEDALCLVFLSEEFADFVANHGDDKTIDVVRKTAKKMTPRAVEMVGQLGLSRDAVALIDRALET